MADFCVKCNDKIHNKELDDDEELFKELMRQVTESRGEQLLALAEELNADSTVIVPEEVTKRALETIEKKLKA